MDCGCGGFVGLEGDAGGCGEGFVAGEREGLDGRVWGMKKAGEEGFAEVHVNISCIYVSKDGLLEN